MVTSKFPIINISTFILGKNKEKVAAQVDAACQEFGSFIILGHGIPLSYMNDCYLASKRFFNLPLEEKMKFHIPNSGMGYLPLGSENLANSLDMNETDNKETLNLGFDTEQIEQLENIQELKQVPRQYYNIMSGLSSILMRLFALALGLPESYLINKIGQPESILRLAHYPPVEGEFDLKQFRVGTHTDYGTITILWSDDLHGLQVLHQSTSTWIDVPLTRSFVVNIGDLMMFWTNGRWNSSIHRVKITPNKRFQHRTSLVFFHNPDPDTVITPISYTGTTLRYPPITAREYRRLKSKRSLDTKTSSEI